VGPVTDIDILVTDSATDPQYLRPLREAGVELILADVRDQAVETRDNDTGRTRPRSGSRH
jgi:hypothetical protein